MGDSLNMQSSFLIFNPSSVPWNMGVKLTCTIMTSTFTSDASLRFIGEAVAITHPMIPFTSSRWAWLYGFPSFKCPSDVRAITSSKLLLPPQCFRTRESEPPSAPSSSPTWITVPWQSSAKEPIQLRPSPRSPIIQGQPSPWPHDVGGKNCGGWGKLDEQGQTGARGWQGENWKREQRGKQRQHGEWLSLTSGPKWSIHSGTLRFEARRLSVKVKTFRSELLNGEEFLR